MTIPNFPRNFMRPKDLLSETSIKPYSELEEEIEKLKKRIKELIKENDELREQIEKLRNFNRVKACEEFSHELKKTKKELSDAKTELTSLREKQVKMVQEKDNLSNQNQQDKIDIKGLTERVEHLEKDNKDLKDEVEKLRKENPLLQEIKDSKGLATWESLNRLSQETIDQKLEQKLRDFGYPYDIEHLKEIYKSKSTKELCELCGIVFEHLNLIDTNDENLRMLLSHFWTVRNEFNNLNIIIKSKPTEKLENAWEEVVSVPYTSEYGSTSYRNAKQSRPGYKYFWTFSLPEIDVSLLGCIVQYLHRKFIKYAIDEFVEAITKTLCVDLEKFLYDAKIEEENEWKKHLECVTKDDKRTVVGERKELNKDIKKRWEENFGKKMNDIRGELLLNCSKIFTKIQLIESGEEERAEEIKPELPEIKIKEVEKKPEVKVEKGKKRTIPIPSLSREKWDALNDNQKAMFNLMNKIEKIRLVNLVVKFNEETRQHYSKQQVFNIYWDTSKDTTWFDTIDGKKTLIVYLDKEGKVAPNIWYVFKKTIEVA